MARTSSPTGLEANLLLCMCSPSPWEVLPAAFPLPRAGSPHRTGSPGRGSAHSGAPRRRAGGTSGERGSSAWPAPSPVRPPIPDESARTRGLTCARRGPPLWSRRGCGGAGGAGGAGLALRRQCGRSPKPQHRPAAAQVGAARVGMRGCGRQRGPLALDAGRNLGPQHPRDPRGAPGWAARRVSVFFFFFLS